MDSRLNIGPEQIERLLRELERRHGIGLRGKDAAMPAWIRARIERALTSTERGGPFASGGGKQGLEALLADEAWLRRLADELRVGETRFYRDPAQWQGLQRWLLDKYRADLSQGPPRLRALSAGCSSGEEAWTLACLAARIGFKGQVVGVDRSAAALSTAREGVYSVLRLAELPAELRQAYVVVDGASGRMNQALLRERLSVHFVERDISQSLPPGRWELILCKNVLIYFGDEAGEQLVSRLMDALAPGGLLLVARSEVARLRALGLVPLELAAGVPAFQA